MQSKEINEGDKTTYTPNLELPPINLVEPIKWCWGKISFAESLDTFAQNLSFTQPTVFLGVPRIWTKFQQGVLTKLPQKKLNILLSII